MSNPIKKLAGETAIYGLGTMVPRFLNYLLVPLYTIYVFTEAQYGQVTLLYSYVAILLVILTFGMETAFFRYANIAENPHKVFNTATTFVVFIALFFLSIIFLFTGQIAELIQYPYNHEYILLVAGIIVIDAITAIPFAYLRFKKKALKFSSIRIISVVITISLNLIFLIVIPHFAGNNINNLPVYRSTNLVSFVFIANFFGSLSTLFLLWNEFSTFKFKIDKILLKKLLNYGIPILVVSLAFMITEVSDKILLKYLLPDKETADAQLGIYGACFKLAIIMVLFTQMFRYAAEPFFFAEAAKKDAKKTYSDVMSVFTGFSWAIFLLVMLYIDVFKFFIGKAFWAGLTIVPIILMAKLFMGLYYNLSVWYKLTNHTIYGAIIAIIGGTTAIVLNIFLIPEYGIQGAAWANFSSYLIMLLISYFWGRKVFRVKYNIVKILMYSSIALIIFFVSGKIQYFSSITYYIIVSLMFVAYLAIFVVSELRHSNKTSNRQ